MHLFSGSTKVLKTNIKLHKYQFIFKIFFKIQTLYGKVTISSKYNNSMTHLLFTDRLLVLYKTVQYVLDLKSESVTNYTCSRYLNALDSCSESWDYQVCSFCNCIVCTRRVFFPDILQLGAFLNCMRTCILCRTRICDDLKVIKN